MKQTYFCVLYFFCFLTANANNELQVAIKNIQYILDSKTRYEDSLINHHLQDFISCHSYNIEIGKIRCLENCRWNKSQKTRSIEYKNKTIIIKKYNLRKNKLLKNNTYKVYKLWSFEIYKKNKFKCKYFWTHLGDMIIDNIPTKEITLKDLIFLKPFMETQIAQKIFGDL